MKPGSGRNMLVNGTITASGANGYVDLYGFPGVTVNGAILANGASGLYVDSSGAFTQGKGNITAPAVLLDAYQVGSSKTPLSVNSPSVQLDGYTTGSTFYNYYINDTSTQSTNLILTGYNNRVTFLLPPLHGPECDHAF